MNYSAPTPPSPLTRVILTQKALRRRWLWIILAFFVFPLFCCGTSLLTYLIFPPAPVNIVVLGTDGRAGEGFLSRTDSIMVIGVKPSQLRLSLLSIPRDIFIEVPGYGSQRVNTINVLGEQERPDGGPSLVMSSISQDFGIRLERYIRLDFNGFVKLVDAVGGVTIDVERPITDDSYPTEDGGFQYIHFDAGVQQMDGERALIYSRTRHGDDDYQRAARQQQVISALFGKLVNPLRWPAALGVLQSSVDTNLTPIDMFTLVVPAALSRGRYEQLVVNRDYILGSPSGNAIPNYDLLNPWLQEHLR